MNIALLVRPLLLVLFGVFLLLANPNAAQADTGKDSLGFVPSNKTMVVGAFNMESFRKSPSFKDGMKRLIGNPKGAFALQMLKDKADFDIERDLSSLLFAIPSDVEKSESYLIVLSGNFNEKKIVELLKIDGSVVESKYQGNTLYQLDPAFVFSFSERKIIIGDMDGLRAALDTRAKKIPAIGSNPHFKKLIASVNMRQDLWFSFKITDEMRKSMKEGVAPAGTLQSVNGSLDFQKGMKFSSSFFMGDESSAKSMAALLQLMIGEATKSPEVKALPGVENFINSTDIKRDSSKVDVEMKMEASDWKALQEFGFKEILK